MTGAGPTPANATDSLRTFKLKGSYYFQRKYGGTLGYFQTTGSADEGLYGTGANGKSVFVSAVATILGDYSTNAPMLMMRVTLPSKTSPNTSS